MIAEGNEYLMQATQELYECNTDDLIRQQCYAREEYYKYQRTIDKVLKDTTAERDRLAEEKDQLLTENNQLTTQNNQLTTKNAEALKTIQEQKNSLQEKNNALKEKDNALKEKDAEILRLKALLASK